MNDSSTFEVWHGPVRRGSLPIKKRRFSLASEDDETLDTLDRKLPYLAEFHRCNDDAEPPASPLLLKKRKKLQAIACDHPAQASQDFSSIAGPSCSGPPCDMMISPCPGPHVATFSSAVASSYSSDKINALAMVAAAAAAESHDWSDGVPPVPHFTSLIPSSTYTSRHSFAQSKLHYRMASTPPPIVSPTASFSSASSCSSTSKIILSIKNGIIERPPDMSLRPIGSTAPISVMIASYPSVDDEESDVDIAATTTPATFATVYSPAATRLSSSCLSMSREASRGLLPPRSSSSWTTVPPPPPPPPPSLSHVSAAMGHQGRSVCSPYMMRASLGLEGQHDPTQTPSSSSSTSSSSSSSSPDDSMDAVELSSQRDQEQSDIPHLNPASKNAIARVRSDTVTPDDDVERMRYQLNSPTPQPVKLANSSHRSPAPSAAVSASSIPQDKQHPQDKRYAPETAGPDEHVCRATTTRGRPCAYVAVGSTAYCHLHADYGAHAHMTSPRRRYSQVGAVATPTKMNAASGNKSNSLSNQAGTKAITKKQSKSMQIPSDYSFEDFHQEESAVDGDGCSRRPCLSDLSTDQWFGQTVHISVGPMRNHVGTVQKWGNGWVTVQVAGSGECCNRRALELFLVTEESDSPNRDDAAVEFTSTPSKKGRSKNLEPTKTKNKGKSANKTASSSYSDEAKSLPTTFSDKSSHGGPSSPSALQDCLSGTSAIDRDRRAIHRKPARYKNDDDGGRTDSNKAEPAVSPSAFKKNVKANRKHLSTPNGVLVGPRKVSLDPGSVVGSTTCASQRQTGGGHA